MGREMCQNAENPRNSATKAVPIRYRFHRYLGLSAHSTLLAAPRAILVQSGGLRNTCTRAHSTEYLLLGLDLPAASK